MEPYITKAKEYAESCFSGKRWGGNPLLIIIDAALTSTGLKYFTVVIPRVERFKREFPLTLEKFSKLPPSYKQFLSIFRNPRVWSVSVEVSKYISQIARVLNLTEFMALKHWAQHADPDNWESDPIGRINGIGLNTFQYLRMQVGVDTTMPDRIIWQWVEQKTKQKFKSPLDLIKKTKQFADSIGISQVELCWRVWLSLSDKEF